MRRTKEQAAQTRQKILDAAVTLFVAHGYESVSLDQIAAAADVKRGAVHFHFHNKAGLMAAMFDAAALPVRELAERLEVGSTAPPLESLCEVTIDVLREFSEDPHQRAIFRILLGVAAATADPKESVLLAFDRRIRSALAQICTVARRRGELAAGWTPDLAALTLHCALSGLIEAWARGSDDVDIAVEGVQMLEALIRTIRAPVTVEPSKRTTQRRRAATTPAKRAAKTSVTPG